jgi:arylsulfatase A-like enzyme
MDRLHPCRRGRRFLAFLGLVGRAPRALPLVVVLVAASGCDGIPSPGEATRLQDSAARPNVLVISFDALRADALGVYGSSSRATPNIDAFARRASVYSNAYSAAPVTPTSFASLFSGQYPTRAFRGWQFVPTTSLAQYFSNAGYQTAAFVNNVQLAPERSFGVGFETYEWRRNDPDPRVLDEALRWLENRDRRRPLFFWLHLLRPHAPYRAREEAAHLYREDDHGRFATGSGPTFATSEPHEVRRIEDLYRGEVWEADRLFGRFERAIRRLGLTANTIVVLTADHGEELGEHGGFQHGRLYEEHLRVPLILFDPAAEPRVIDGTVRARAVDLLPTLLEIAGIEPEEGLAGRSLLTAREDEQEPSPVVAISMTAYPKETSLSLLAGDHKLILNCRPTRSVELYDLGRDPAERADVQADHPSATRRLLGTLRKVIGKRPCRIAEEAQIGGSPTRPLDAESIEALRSLGYLD